MAKLYFLGTGAPASDPHRTTVMLGLEEGSSTLLIDCGGDVVQRARLAGLNTDHLDAIFLTHEHPDHVGGFALFMEKMWLYGRRDPISVIGPAPALNQADRCFSAYDTARWEGLPSIAWNPIPLEERAVALDNDVWHIMASPGKHGVPVVGLRIHSSASGAAVCYSADTRPCDSIRRLAEGCRLLVHEAAGNNPVHSTASDAAGIARDAAVEELVLIHVPAGMTDDDLRPAREIFPNTRVAEEMETYTF